MRWSVAFAQERLELELDPVRLVARPRAPLTPLADPVAAIRTALEGPFHFPALRRALTPDDHIAVVVDEGLTGLGRLLTPVLEHIVSAGVQPEAITLVSPPDSSRQDWVDDLPDDLQEVHLERHDPANRQRLAYLATTAAGRRLYLNRSVVEADQLVVVGRRWYDQLLGQAGAEGEVYPFLGDQETREELLRRWNFAVPGKEAWPMRQEAIEVNWLLGTPFFVQIIPGQGDSVAYVVAGVAEAAEEGRRLLDACWRQEVAEPADLVVASISGDPDRVSFADLAAAAASAARVVRPEGRIVLLTRAQPDLGPCRDLLFEAGEPEEVQQKLERDPKPELLPALLWAKATAHAHVSLLSELPEETVENLFAAPLPDLAGVQRWLDRGGSCVLLEDAHKTLAVLRK
jgi:nickel-dependent lactate racemase